MVRVLLVEHPPAVRRALRESLMHEPDIDLVGEASSMQGALRMVERLHPEAVVLDAEMDGLDIEGAIAMFDGRVPATAVVVVAIEPDRLGRLFVDDARVAIVGKIDGVTALVCALRNSVR